MNLKKRLERFILLSNGKKITWYKNAKQIYRKYGAKEVLRTLSFNYVLLHKKDIKMYQVIFLLLLRRKYEM